MSPPRVAFVSQWYPPEPTVQPAWIAEGLAETGNHVQVLTGVPNYPSGRVAAGYSARRTSSEVRNGLRVTRTPLYPSHDTSSLRRFLNYASWAVSATFLGQGVLRSSDVALVYSSPATAALPAMAAKRLWGTPYVLLVQDVWPDSIFASGFLVGRTARWAERLVTAFVDRAYGLAEHVVVTSPGMIELLQARGVPDWKVSLVHNWVDEVTIDVAQTAGHEVRKALGIQKGDFVVMYAGNHGAAQALETAVDAFTSIPAGLGCHLVMIGDGVSKQTLVDRACGDPRIHFVDPQPRSEISRFQAAADVHLVSLADRPLFAVTMPSKLQSILQSGAPVLAMARGDVAAVVQESRAGFAVSPGDREGMARTVTALAQCDKHELAEMGGRGREYYQARMSRTIGIGQLAALLCRAAEQDHSGPTTDEIEGETK